MIARTSPKAFGVWFRETTRWDVKYFSSRLESKYPFVALGEYIQEHNEKVNLFEYPDSEFDILGVDNARGVFFAYRTTGKKIHQPYKKVSAGDFVYNPYRVNIGSIGIVPESLGQKFISPAYVVFSVDRNAILPKLLELILKSSWFNPRLRAATAGSVRQNLTFELLRTLEIPLPPIDVQSKILTVWEQAQVKIIQAQERAIELEQEIEARFFSDLGLKPPKKTSRLKAFAVWWRDFERWSVSYNQAAQSGMDIAQGKYPVYELGSLLELVQYGTSEKANSGGDGVPVIRMNNIVDGVLDLSDLKYVKLNERDRKRLLLRDNDILFNRTNSKELVGKCAVFHESGEYVFASYLVRVRPDSAKANSDFVAYVINSPIGRQQINAMSRQIIGQANVNTQELRSLQIPLPPLDIQKDIMRRIEEGRKKIRQELESVERIKAEAERSIERMILGLTKV